MATFIGVLGAAIILVFFVLEQGHKINRDDVLYDTGNFFGGLLLLTYSYMLGSLPFGILAAVWALVSLRDIARKPNKRK